jgi:hypothetical protein
MLEMKFEHGAGRIAFPTAVDATAALSGVTMCNVLAAYFALARPSSRVAQIVSIRPRGMMVTPSALLSITSIPLLLRH